MMRSGVVGAREEDSKAKANRKLLAGNEKRKRFTDRGLGHGGKRGQFLPQNPRFQERLLMIVGGIVWPEDGKGGRDGRKAG